MHSRRPSLLSALPGSDTGREGRELLAHCVILGSSISKQEATVINIGDPDGPPRLVGPDSLYRSQYELTRGL